MRGRRRLAPNLLFCAATASAVPKVHIQAVGCSRGDIMQLGVQEYTDDTAELRRQVDALGGIAALQDPERQLQAIMELEQFVSAVRHLPIMSMS